MNPSYKGIIFDIDDTAVPTGDQVVSSQRLIQAFRSLPEAMHAIPATGRSYTTARPILQQLGVKGPAIIANGALIVNSEDGSIISSALLPSSEVAAMLQLAGAHDVFLAGTAMEKPAASETVQPQETAALYVINLTQQTVDLLIPQFTQFEQASVYVSKAAGNPDLFDINVNHARASKATAIEEVTARLALDPKELIGIGDWTNDLPIFEHVGLKVAMSGGHPDLLARADVIAPSLAMDGLAHTIETYLLRQAS